MLKIANDIVYNLPLEKRHRFPMLKYKLLPELLINEGTCTKENFFCPRDICDDDILLTHSKSYYDNLLNFRNYGNQIVWRAFNAYGPEKSFNSKSCGTKPNVTLYYFGSNSSCIQIGNTICNNSSGTSCRVSTGVYYTTYCFDQWIEVLYDSKQGAYTVVNLGYCSPP